jgi:Ser/Thr protein kinase RdoA (MazF antagonist)
MLHDAFEPSGDVPARSIVAATRSLAETTDRLAAPAKASILAHVERHARSLAEVGDLPLRRTHGDWILRNVVVDEAGRDRVVDCDSMRAGDNLRWYDIAYLLINLESQMKWSPLLRRSDLAPLWRSFWNGYRGHDHAIEGLSGDQMAALLYLARVQYLLGGTIRVPLHQMFGGGLGRRYLRALVAGLAAGEPALLDDGLAW